MYLPTPRPTFRPVSRLASLLAVLAVVGCSDGTVPTRLVAGVDLDELFAPPTTAERAAVEADWSARAPAAIDVVVEDDRAVQSGSFQGRLRVVSHLVDGTLRHYGAVLTPDSLPGPAPVVVYAHGGDQGVSLDELLFILPALGPEASKYVWVVPSFRSEPVSIGTDSWRSEGVASPWDRDVDDALALLEVGLDIEPLADPSRIGVLGLSRGAGVGLLMAIRDPRISRVVEFFGPTDFFGPFVQDVVRASLMGMPRSLPGVDVLDETFIRPLSQGTLDLAQVRIELLRRSPARFADRLPAVQIHHGTADGIVEVSQAVALIEAMEGLGRGEPDFQSFLYDGGTHNPLTLNGSLSRTVAFLGALLP